MSPCCCDYNSETFDHCVAEVVKARKPYQCIECDEDIRAGEQYERFSGVYDGYWVHAKTCLVCAYIRKDLCAPIGGLRATVMDCLGVDLI